jgi:hypothetical protein
MAETWLEHFRECFEDRIDFVRATCLDRERPRPEGLLLLTGLLDALAGYRYYQMAGNYARFRFLLRDHSGERDFWSTVSVYRLYEELLYCDNKERRSFAQELYQRYNLSNFLADPVEFNPDLAIDQVCNGLDEVRKFAEGCEYSAILWSYRNYAVHEGTNLNVPPPCPFGSEVEPVLPYYSVVPLLSERRMVKLIIPTQYVLKTLEACLESFVKDCEQGQFDFEKMRELKNSQRPYTRE